MKEEDAEVLNSDQVVVKPEEAEEEAEEEVDDDEPNEDEFEDDDYLQVCFACSLYLPLLLAIELKLISQMCNQ